MSDLVSAARERNVDALRDELQRESAGQHLRSRLNDALACVVASADEGDHDAAVLERRKQMFDLLLERGADVDADARGAPPRSDARPIVAFSGDTGSVDGLQWLIDAGCDVERAGEAAELDRPPPSAALRAWLRAPVATADERRRKHAGLRLLQRRLTTLGEASELWAVHCGDADELARLGATRDGDVLNTRRYDCAQHGRRALRKVSLLHCAVALAERDCARVLLELGADVNARGSGGGGGGEANGDPATTGGGGATPVFYALRERRDDGVEMLQLLAQRHGADLTVRAKLCGGKFAFTPLELAESAGVDEHTRRLLRALDEAAHADRPQLWRCCRSFDGGDDDGAARVARAQRLLDGGDTHVNASVGRDGSTALHQAAWRGPLRLVELLLRHGAREWIGDVFGQWPAAYARAARQHEIAALLKRPVIRDEDFRRALRAVHGGRLEELRALLRRRPELATTRVEEPECYPEGYFGNPALLWFVAYNPELSDEAMPDNIVATAHAIVDAGASVEDMDYTIELVMTSDEAKRRGQQVELVDALLARGAHIVARAVEMTLAHNETQLVERLLELRRLSLSAPIAAALGRAAELRRLWESAPPSPEELHSALSMAVINDQTDTAEECVRRGADVNARLRVHKHSCPAHHAAGSGFLPLLQLLVERGARLDVRDDLWNGTPLGWAVHGKHDNTAEYLRSIGAAS